MSRRAAREIAFQIIFASGFSDNPKWENCNLLNDNAYSFTDESNLDYKNLKQDQKEYIDKVVSGTISHLAELDSYIEKYAVDWNFGRISRIATAIMRLVMYELLYMQDIPSGASINEAVELAKKYDSDEAAAFINGLLGTFSRKELLS